MLTMTSSNINLPKPNFIQDQAVFNHVVDNLSQENVLAVDTEANSLYAYHERVCLIQISTREQDIIIDPLAINDLSALGEVFSNPKIEKIFHASEYDILILFDDFQFEFQNLFDTMIAAQILGRKKLGLDALLEEFFGVKVNKKFQRANWGKRPLTEEMLHYAQMDTHFLLGIREHLARELEESELQPIAAEDFVLASRAHLVEREEKIPPCWRINGARNLPPQKAAVLQQLSIFRDQTARRIDKPLFKILSKKTLLALAEASPTNHSQLRKLNLNHQKSIERYSNGILEAVQIGLKSDPIQPPRTSRPDDGFLAREKALKSWRKNRASKMKVNSAVVLPKNLLNDVARENPLSLPDLEWVLREVPWRFNQFGEEILQTLKRVQY